MTDKEKAIVMAFTGTCMLTGDKFKIFHEYVEKLMGRPVYTHELGFLADEIKEKARDDFIGLCKADTELDKTLDKIRAEIAEYGSIWVEYKNAGRSDKDIEQLVSDVLKQAKEQVLDVIDKYKYRKGGAE